MKKYILSEFAPGTDRKGVRVTESGSSVDDVVRHIGVWKDLDTVWCTEFGENDWRKYKRIVRYEEVK